MYYDKDCSKGKEKSPTYTHKKLFFPKELTGKYVNGLLHVRFSTHSTYEFIRFWPCAPGVFVVAAVATHTTSAIYASQGLSGTNMRMTTLRPSHWLAIHWFL